MFWSRFVVFNIIIIINNKNVLFFQSPKSDQQQQRPSGGKKARAQSAPNVTPDTTTTTSLSSMLAVTAADRGGAGSGPAPADGGGVPSSLSPPALSPSVAPGKPVCDKSLLDYTQRASLPEFNSFQRPGGGTAEHKQSPVGLGHHMPDGNGGLALIGKVRPFLRSLGKSNGHCADGRSLVVTWRQHTRWPVGKLLNYVYYI